MLKWWRSALVLNRPGKLSKRKICAAYYTRRKVHLPLEMVEQLCQYMDTDTFHNFVKASWPNGEEDDTFTR